jgi:hypothetical protein
VGVASVKVSFHPVYALVHFFARELLAVANAADDAGGDEDDQVDLLLGAASRLKEPAEDRDVAEDGYFSFRRRPLRRESIRRARPCRLSSQRCLF